MSEVLMTPVSSTLVKAVGYDEASKELHVRFHKGRSGIYAYVYAGVPQEVYDEMMAQKSVGAYFIKNIKLQYPWREVKDE